MIPSTIFHICLGVAMTEGPVDETDNGYYPITQPFEGTVPDEITITVDGVTYRFSEFVGRKGHSRIYPDVLLYDDAEVVG